MSSEVVDARPNIRIEIPNVKEDAMEMEVDATDEIENEEGEISDDGDDQNNITASAKTDKPSSNNFPNTRAIFTTGINIFDKEAQEKLEERARRFALKPEEIVKFTDNDLQILHESLGISPINENEVRFEAIHMIGAGQLTTEDVLDYFVKYAPVGIEWIDKDSCNVVWADKVSAARALHFMSKYVRGMPARGPCDPFVDDSELENAETGDGRSILLKNQNREVELKIDEEMIQEKKHDIENSVDISEITIPIPPGYWRLGSKHLKSKCLLLRFSLITDKQPFKSESFAKYYKRLGNLNSGTSKGVLSESKKNEIRGIFERNKELHRTKNPWGPLAKNWDHDVQFREREKIIEVEDDDEQPVEIKNPKILARLGKRKKDDEQSEELEEGEEKDEKEPAKKSKVPRMKMYADEEEEKIKRKKALQRLKQKTEEIAKTERSDKDLRDILGITKRRPLREEQVVEPVVDLGARLRNRTRNPLYALERALPPPLAYEYMYYNNNDPVYDQRSLYDQRSMGNGHVERAIHNAEYERPRATMSARLAMDTEQMYRAERAERLERERERMERERLERERLESRRSRSIERRSPEKRRRSTERRSHRRRSVERTLHSDRMHSDRMRSDRVHSSRSSRNDDRHRRHRMYSEREEYSTKPKSKVAVVIKTQKRPAVASTVWSRVSKPESASSSSEESSEEESSSSSSSSSGSSSSGSDSESSSSSEESRRNARGVDRPGFDRIKRAVVDKLQHRSPLKITMTNDRFRRK